MPRVSQTLFATKRRRQLFVAGLIVLLLIMGIVLTRPKGANQNNSQADTSTKSSTQNTSSQTVSLPRTAVTDNSETSQNVIVHYPSNWQEDSSASSELALKAPGGLQVIIQTGLEASDDDSDMNYRPLGSVFSLLGAPYQLAGATYVGEDDTNNFVGVFVVNAAGTSRQIPLGTVTTDGTPAYAQISITGGNQTDSEPQNQTLSSLRADKEFTTALAVIKSVKLK